MSQRQIIVSFIVISAATMCKFVSFYHFKNEESTIYESSYNTDKTINSMILVHFVMKEFIAYLYVAVQRLLTYMTG